MKSQSSYSSWYFIERATIGDIRVNCTISLSSQILNSGRRDQRAHAEQKNTLFGKAIGASDLSVTFTQDCKFVTLMISYR